jgi:hypothetical protein
MSDRALSRSAIVADLACVDASFAFAFVLFVHASNAHDGDA